MHLTFGVVKRLLNSTATSPNFFWTMLAAEGDSRCMLGDS
jgi:hypothetical protein